MSSVAVCILHAAFATSPHCLMCMLWNFVKTEEWRMYSVREKLLYREDIN